MRSSTVSAKVVSSAHSGAKVASSAHLTLDGVPSSREQCVEDLIIDLSYKVRNTISHPALRNTISLADKVGLIIFLRPLQSASWFAHMLRCKSWLAHPPNSICIFVTCRAMCRGLYIFF